MKKKKKRKEKRKRKKKETKAKFKRSYHIEYAEVIIECDLDVQVS